jgi:hypothetical protein
MTGDEALVAGEKAPPGEPPDADMVWVPGGEFLTGSDRQYPEEAPAHRVATRSGPDCRRGQRGPQVRQEHGSAA